MKRYVKELAADRKRDLLGCIKWFEQNGTESDIQACKEEIARFENILIQCEYGYISDYEAVRQLITPY